MTQHTETLYMKAKYLSPVIYIFTLYDKRNWTSPLSPVGGTVLYVSLTKKRPWRAGSAGFILITDFFKNYAMWALTEANFTVTLEQHCQIVLTKEKTKCCCKDFILIFDSLDLC